jgi:hypothetical protein
MQCVGLEPSQTMLNSAQGWREKYGQCTVSAMEVLPPSDQRATD